MVQRPGRTSAALYCVAAALCNARGSVAEGAQVGGCPGMSPRCDCDWTANGTRCGSSDDGSECFCRCCCPYEGPGFVCKWKPPPPSPPPPPPLPPPPPPPPGITSPAEMVAKMGLGINLGNTLEAPFEGNWAPAAKESFFDEYKRAGFTNVRVPVQWDHHTAQEPPYAINVTFMDRVEQVIDWSLARGLVTVMNTHHENWLDNQTTFAAGLPRLVAIWQQIGLRFQGKPQTLLFEVFNEPHIMTVEQLNQMNAAVLPMMRRTNPNRIVFLGGLQWMNPNWQTANKWAMAIPKLSDGSVDPQLALEIHNYDPPQYAMCKTASVCKFGRAWGTAADLSSLDAWMGAIKAWSQTHHLPIYYGEFGCTHAQNASTGRDVWYAAHATAIQKHGFAASVWDDDGMFRVFDRNADTWDVGVLKALGKQKPVV